MKPKLPCCWPVVVGSIGAAEATWRNKHTSISPSPSLSVSLRPTVCLPSTPSISITPLCSDLLQTKRGSLVYSHMERGGGHHLSFWVELLVSKIVWRSERKSKESWLLLTSHTHCFTNTEQLLSLSLQHYHCLLFPTALPEHKQYIRNFQAGTQFAHCCIVLFRSVHSLKTTSFNDC